MSNIDDAFLIYKKHIYDKEKIYLLGKHNLKIAGCVPSVLWELFGATLTGRLGNGVIGADLKGWEVKSAKKGASFEYQYHLNTGLSKLKEDCVVSHLFCSYSESYNDVAVRAIKGSKLKGKYFDEWLPLYRENYDKDVPAGKRRQRFRKSISNGYVESHGLIIMNIVNGEIVERGDDALQLLSLSDV